MRFGLFSGWVDSGFQVGFLFFKSEAADLVVLEAVLGEEQPRGIWRYCENVPQWSGTL